jgi:hypothetical protein
MKRYVPWLVYGLCLVLAGFCSAADSITIPLDCKGLKASGVGQHRIEVSDSRVFGTAPSRQELVRESNGLGVLFLETPGDRRNPCTASVAR